MSQSRNTPLKLRPSSPTSIEMVEHLLAITQRVNSHEERISTLEVDIMTVVGETSRSNAAVLNQVNTLSDVVRELRDVLIPGGGVMRQKLITIPKIDVEQVRSVIDHEELERRRRESIRIREDDTEKKRLELEDKLASKRDAKNARIALYTTLGVGIFIEILRLLITHSP